MATKMTGNGGFSRREMLKTTSAAVGGAMASVAAPAVLRAQARPIKIGLVTPATGPLAFFAEADGYVLDTFKKAVGAGIKIGDNTHPVEVIVKDSQSNSNRAAEVANELILGSKIDLMVVAHTPDTVNPVADQCEVNEVPCISTDAPWQPYFFGRHGDPAILRMVFADFGALYLMILGAVAIVVMLFARKGLWGLVAEHYGWSLFPLSRRILLFTKT